MSVPLDQGQPINEIIEPVNRYFHNPIAANVVKILKNTWVTPDQITYTSIFIGLASAYIFSSGTIQSFFLAGILLEVVMILDCVDGQLAREKKCASYWGRLLDGIAGYIIYLAVLIGIMIGLGKYYVTLVVIGTLTIMRAISYDYCKLTMTTMIQKGYDGNQKEISDTYLKVFKTGSIILKAYFYYLQFQRYIFCGQFVSLDQFDKNNSFNYQNNILIPDQRKDYRKKNGLLMIVWSWSGVDLPIFLLVMVSVFGGLEFFLKPIAYFLVLQFVLTMVYHRMQYSRFS